MRKFDYFWWVGLVLTLALGTALSFHWAGRVLNLAGLIVLACALVWEKTSRIWQEKIECVCDLQVRNLNNVGLTNEALTVQEIKNALLSPYQC